MAERTGKASAREDDESQFPRADVPTVPDDLSWLARTDHPLRILVAEDTRAYQEIVKAILGQRGHALVVVGNGREAVDSLERDNFDVVLMDAHMPTMDGLEATAAIRRNPDACRAAVPIIAITAHSHAGSRDRCLAAGMSDYLAKPFDPAQLVRLVEQHGHR